MGQTVVIYNNRVTVIHMPKAGKVDVSPETFAAMSSSAQMASMIRPKYAHQSVALVPGPNQVSREHLEMLEGKHNAKRNEAWMRFVRRGWVSLKEQPSVRALPQRGSSSKKRYDNELAAVPGYRLPEGSFQAWPERPIESLFDTADISSMQTDNERLRAAAKGMGISLTGKDGKALSSSDLVKAMAAKVAEADAKKAEAAEAKPARIASKPSK